MIWPPAPSRAPDPADEVHVWRVWLDGEALPDEAGLPAEERRRAEAIQIEERRRRWVAARWALRLVLSRYTGEQPAELRIEEGDGGKPRLAGEAEVSFNLAHSSELALVAITKGREIGIDVERVKPGRPDAYYRDWVRREALAKCSGSGLWGPPPDGPVELTDLDAGQGWAAAVALASTAPAPIRRFELRA